MIDLTQQLIIRCVSAMWILCYALGMYSETEAKSDVVYKGGHTRGSGMLLVSDVVLPVPRTVVGVDYAVAAFNRVDQRDVLLV